VIEEYGIETSRQAGRTAVVTKVNSTAAILLIHDNCRFLAKIN